MRVRTGLFRDSDFRYMPGSLPVAQGYLQAIYADSTQEDSRTRTTTEMLEDKDRENRALRLELFNTRADHWATLTRFAPAVQAGYSDMRDLYPVRSALPDVMGWRDVGGITPPRGPRRPPSVGPRPHPSPYGPQAPRDRLFPDDMLSFQAMEVTSTRTTTDRSELVVVSLVRTSCVVYRPA